jgi:hypothetical protein
MLIDLATFYYALTSTPTNLDFTNGSITYNGMADPVVLKQTFDYIQVYNSSADMAYLSIHPGVEANPASTHGIIRIPEGASFDLYIGVGKISLVSAGNSTVLIVLKKGKADAF